MASNAHPTLLPSVDKTAHNRRRPCRLAHLSVLSVALLYLGAVLPVAVQAQDIIEFEASDSQRQDQLNGFMSLLLDPAQNPSGQTAINIPASMPWFDDASRLRLILGANGMTPLQFSIFAGLRDVRLDATGYSWMSFTSHGWPFPRWDDSEGEIPGWEFNGGSTQGWSVANVTGSTVSNGIWSFQTNHGDPQLISPSTSFQASFCPLVRVYIGCDSGGPPARRHIGFSSSGRLRRRPPSPRARVFLVRIFQKLRLRLPCRTTSSLSTRSF